MITGTIPGAQEFRCNALRNGSSCTAESMRLFGADLQNAFHVSMLENGNTDNRECAVVLKFEKICFQPGIVYDICFLGPCCTTQQADIRILAVTRWKETCHFSCSSEDYEGMLIGFVNEQRNQ